VLLLGRVGEDPSCRDLERRSSGSLQGFAESLLRRVPFNLLEAQVGGQCCPAFNKSVMAPPLQQPSACSDHWPTLSACERGFAQHDGALSQHATGAVTTVPGAYGVPP